MRSNPSEIRNPDDRSPFGHHAISAPARQAWSRAGVAANPLWKEIGRRFPGPYDLSVDRMRLRIYPNDNLGDRTIAMSGKLPEPDELAMIEPWLAQGGCFIDVGANIGIYSIFASRCVGEDGHVLAFEPHPQTFRKLAFNLEANRCSNVEPLRCALGEYQGECNFHPDGGKNVGRSSLLRQAVGTPVEAIRVEMRRLDRILSERGRRHPDLIKLDVEGYEDRVLAALFAAPQQFWPNAVFLEYVHCDLWQEDIVARMKALRYHEAGKTDRNLLLARLPDGKS